MRKLSIDEIKAINEVIDIDTLKPVIQRINQANGIPFLVGGAVRDLLLKKPLKDLDFEVHNLSLSKLKKILKQFGNVNEVGKSFGILKFVTISRMETDWSLPRTDDIGRKPKVTIDVTMGIKQALKRRDLTINAMAIDMLTHTLYDPFNGEKDLYAGRLTYPNEQIFMEDPLRFFRVMQFMGRFGFMPDKKLNATCTTMDISSLANERIEEELRKLLLRSKEPSLAFRWLQNIGRLHQIFPEIAVLSTIAQSSLYHPEGDVFEHTMQVLDAAAEISNRLSSDEERLILLYSALCHDLGKAVASTIDKNGKITSHGHEIEGVTIAERFLKRFCRNKEIIAAVKKLVRNHMYPVNLLNNRSKISSYKRLALRLTPEVNGELLALLFEADSRGRNGKNSKPLLYSKEAEKFLDKIKAADVLLGPEPAILTGKDLLDCITPGPELGQMLKMAYELQISEGIRDKDLLKKRVLSNCSNGKN